MFQSKSKIDTANLYNYYNTIVKTVPSYKKHLKKSYKGKVIRIRDFVINPVTKEYIFTLKLKDGSTKDLNTRWLYSKSCNKNHIDDEISVFLVGIGTLILFFLTMAMLGVHS